MCCCVQVGDAMSDLLIHVSVDAQEEGLNSTLDMELRGGFQEVLVIQGNRQYLLNFPFAALSTVQIG